MNEIPILLSCYIIEDSSVFVAQCIEKDFCAQGSSRWDAKNGLVAVISAQLMLDRNHKRWPFETTPEPPKDFLKYFEEKKAWFTEFKVDL